MAKRFTDTGKWKRPWFRALSLQGKVLWQYICDEVDHVGILIADFELISFQVGFKVDEPKLAEMLGDKLVKISDDKYFVPSFFEFQYADAKDGFRAKQSAIKTLRVYGLIEESSDSLRDLTDSYLSVQGQSPDYPSKIKIKIKSKINTGSVEGAYTPEFEAAWKTYPRKDDKSEAFRAYLLTVTPDEYADVLKAIEAYRTKLKRSGTSAEYVKLGATFFNKRRWRDCLEPTYGQAEDFSQNNPGQLNWAEITGAKKEVS